MSHNKLFLSLVVLLALGAIQTADAQKKKSFRQLTKTYMGFVKSQNKGRAKLAQKRASDPATVTRDKAEAAEEEDDDPYSAFQSFRNNAYADYEEFRNKCNADYAEFLQSAWGTFQATPGQPKPKDEEKPPVVIEEKEEQKPVVDRPIPIKETVLPPAPEEQPLPVAPIVEQDEPSEYDNWKDFTIYGTTLSVRFEDSQRFRLSKCNEDAVAEAWLRLSEPDYNNTLCDCLAIREDMQLSDWAYLNMLDAIAKACLGDGNEATLLAAFFYCQTGYQMRLAFGSNKLYMLYASKHYVYGKPYFLVDDEFYYPFNCEEENLQICEAAFPQEKPLSLLVPQQQLFTEVLTPSRTLTSQRYPEMSLKVSVNRNLVEFYDSYPTSSLGKDFMTRWAMYANTPVDCTVGESLYPALHKQLQGLSQLEAVERLLNWVQTAFVYEYDENVWGHDRAFFTEETLYYPKCDCEDRSILLSRLVRDLLGLKTVLVYYPGHLAMAVGFTEDVRGDFLTLGGERYIVCDPTYINARVGRTMPGMDNAQATAILLQ